MKGRRRMTATSDSWQVSDGQREREGGGEKELLFSKANPRLCLTGKTQSRTERVYNLRCPLRHMTVHPRVSGRPLRASVCVCLHYVRIQKKTNIIQTVDKNKSKLSKEKTTCCCRECLFFELRLR